MNIEDEILNKYKIDVKKIKMYGFKKHKDTYIYSKSILKDSFRIDICVEKDEKVTVKIFDLSLDEEYTNFRIEGNTGSFAGTIREELQTLLEDIKEKCCINTPFKSEQANRITNMILKKYVDAPIFKWDASPNSGVFQNKDSQKWYAIIMCVQKSKICAVKGESEVEVIDLKLDCKEIQELLKVNGFYTAYHMNKKSWITIILDNTINDAYIMELIEKSYNYAIDKKKKSNEWIIPANPKYYDVEKAFRENNIVNWKQGAGVKVNDIIYLYLAAPISAIIYKCEVLEINIPYNYEDENLKIKKLMKVRLIDTYDKDKYTFATLKEYGVTAIRGPRYMPEELSNKINTKRK